MIIASELRVNMGIKLDGELYKVIAVEAKTGTAQMSGVVHAKLKKLSTGTLTDRRFHPEEKIEDVELEQRPMEFLYSTGDEFYFMDPETYEQISLPKTAIGHLEKFLQPGMKLPIQFYEEKPVSIIFPSSAVVKVVSTGAPIRGETDSTYKSAVLENGMEIMVPLFIKVGDLVKVDVETGRYIERVTKKE